MQRWLNGAFDLFTSDFQMEELRRVNKEKLCLDLIRRSDAGKLVNHMRDFAVLVEPGTIPDLSPDPDDNRILAIAQTSKADYLASLDTRHVLILKKLGKTRIVHARELLKKLS